VYNSYFTEAAGPGATIQDEATVGVADGDGVVVSGVFFGTHSGFGIEGDPISWDAGAWGTFVMDQPGNMDGVDLMLDGAWGAPNIKPAAGTPADGGGVELPAGFEPTTYVGAVDPAAADDWTQAGWINYGD
jgi:hypothetical protein